MLCDKCIPRELRAMRALESLTPLGSEYVNDVERCVTFLREQREFQRTLLVAMKLQNNRLRDEIAELKRRPHEQKP